MNEHTKEQLVESMQKILNGESGINLYFALKQENNEIEVKRADLKDGDTQEHLMGQFESLLKEDFLDNKDLQILQLSKADERKDAIYEYDLVEFPETLQYFSKFSYEKHYDTFSFVKDDLLALDAYIIVIGSQENHCILYKKFYPVFLLGHGSFCLFPSKQRFEEFDKEILRVNRNYQFMKIGEKIYIKDLKILEKYGGFRDIIQREARDAVQSIVELKILEEVDGLLETLKDDASFARKLCKIKNTSPVLECKISNKDIIQFSKTHPGVAGQLKYNNIGDKILLTTKKSQKIF